MRIIIIKPAPKGAGMPLVRELKRYELSKSMQGELDGGRSPASNQINSRQSLALHGFGARSDFFSEYALLQKIGV